MITKTCEQCRIVFTCHQKRVRYCSRCQDKQAYRQKTNPVTAGYAHRGDGITPVPQSVLDRIAQERAGTANNGILSFAFPARQIEALEEEMTALQEWAEDIAQQRRQEKPIQRGIETIMRIMEIRLYGIRVSGSREKVLCLCFGLSKPLHRYLATGKR